VFWEQRHVAHHLLPCLPSAPPRPVDVIVPAEEGPPRVKAA
jgi:hypothetical protein